MLVLYLLSLHVFLQGKPSMILSVRGPFIFAILAILLFVSSSNQAQAGGGPENVFLVVNPKSIDSMTIANHYIKLRNIPSRNVFHLKWNPETGEINVNTFREKILAPILKTIDARGLIGQVDYVVYSTDYPWTIQLYPDIDRFLEAAKKQQKDSSKPVEWPRILTRSGSLTGLTYLYQYVLTKQPIYMGLASNRYVRIMKGGKQTVPTIGFSNRLRFDAQGKPTKKMTGAKYLLSVMLGVTGKHGRRGNTVEEIIQYLERSVAADETFPKGTIYYDDNNGVRSKARKPLFEPAIRELAKLDVKGKIVKSYPPKGTNDTMGLMLGCPSPASLKPWLHGIRPGSIGSNLTSYGGVMTEKHKLQPPLTNFLKAGMAGASGTITEPFAIAAKFPSPMLYVHYARGCSLAEAYYQSVHGPYQLLIVGEPLCRPWAKIPQVSVKMNQQEETAEPQPIQPNQTISGKLTLYPSSKQVGGQKAHHFEIYLDGHLVGICFFEGDVSINSAQFGDGYHELRVVAVAPQPIYTRGYKIVPIKTANHGRTIEVKHSPANKVSLGKSILLKAKCPGATRINIKHNGRSVGQIDSESGQVIIDTNTLGKGPITLQTIGILGKGAKNRVFGKPISLEVK